MSGALDKLTPEEEAQLKQMEKDDLESASQQPDPQPEERVGAPDAEQPPPAKTPAQEAPETTVDKRALDAERNRRREAERRANELAAKHAAELAAVQTRLELLTKASSEYVSQQQAPKAQEPPPDFNTDPAGAIQHGLRSLQDGINQLHDRVGKVEGSTQQTAQQWQQQQQINDLRQWGMAQEAEFARETPDYQQAVNHLANARRQEMIAIGITNEAEIQHHMAGEVQGLANFARQKGISFGKMLYDLSMARGYRAAAPAASEMPNMVSAPVSAPAPLPTANTAAERLVRGQEMATTLGATGAAPRGDPAPQAIANMSDEEFSALYEKVRKQGGAAMRNLFGV